MTKIERRYLKFINSENGQSLAFDWYITEDNPYVLIVTNKVNSLTLSTFEGTSIDSIREMVVMWAFRMIEDDMF